MTTAWALAMCAFVGACVLDFIVSDRHLRQGINVALWLLMLTSFIWGIVVLTT